MVCESDEPAISGGLRELADGTALTCMLSTPGCQGTTGSRVLGVEVGWPFVTGQASRAFAEEYVLELAHW